jgi:hypothetical protein
MCLLHACKPCLCAMRHVNLCIPLATLDLSIIQALDLSAACQPDLHVPNRSPCSVLQYCLTLSMMCMHACTQITNLVSNDVRRFDEAITFWCFLWAAPTELAAVLVLVSIELGPAAAFAGIATMLLVIPVQARALLPALACCPRDVSVTLQH